MSRNAVITLITVAIVLVIVNVVFWSIVLARPSSERPAPTIRPYPTPTTPSVPSQVGGAGGPATPTVPAKVGEVGGSATPSASPKVGGVKEPTASPKVGGLGEPTASPKVGGVKEPTASPKVGGLGGPTATPSPIVLSSVDDVARATAAGQHGVPFRLVFTQQQIANEVTSYLATNPDLVFRDVGVSLQQGQAIITGKANILNFDVGFKATTTIVLADGRPRLKVVALDVLGGLIPGFIKDRLIQMIEQSADLPLLGDLPVVITDVKIEPGQAVVVGNTI